MYSCIKGLLAVKVTGISTTSEEVILRVETITTSAKVVETSVATAKNYPSLGYPIKDIRLCIKCYPQTIYSTKNYSRSHTNVKSKVSRDEQFLLLQFLYKWDIANKWFQVLLVCHCICYILLLFLL